MENLPTFSYYDYQLSNVGKKFGDQVLIKVQLVSLSQATGSAFIGNLSTFDVISSKERREIYLVLLETKKVAPGNTVIFSPKLRHQSSVASYLTDNRSMSTFLF